VPFWILQLAELLAAVAFADLSLHVDRGDLLVGGTVAFALLAVTARGPLGMVRLVPRRLHVLIVCVVCVLFALAPILPQIRPDASGIIIVEFGAIGLFRLATLTRTDVTVRAPKRSGGRQSWTGPSVGGPTGLEAQAGTAAAGPATATAGAGADALAGTATAAGSRAPSGTPSTSEVAARWLARRTSSAAQQASIAAQAAALTAEKHAPAAKAQAGRALRSAGRLTGRLTRSSSSRSPGSDSPGAHSSVAGSPGSDSPAAGPSAAADPATEPCGSPDPASTEASSAGPLNPPGRIDFPAPSIPNGRRDPERHTVSDDGSNPIGLEVTDFHRNGVLDRDDNRLDFRQEQACELGERGSNPKYVLNF